MAGKRRSTDVEVRPRALSRTNRPTTPFDRRGPTAPQQHAASSSARALTDRDTGIESGRTREAAGAEYLWLSVALARPATSVDHGLYRDFHGGPVERRQAVRGRGARHFG
jgi:hypothetical protein